MTYNYKQHKELLKRSEDLKNLGKSLYKENKDEDLELSKYGGVVESWLFWESRILFALFMEKFVNRIISGQEFNDSFLGLRQRILYQYDGFKKGLSSEMLKDFEPDPRSNGFGSFVNFLTAECDNFTDDYQTEEFYDFIKDYFLKLQKVLNEE